MSLGCLGNAVEMPSFWLFFFLFNTGAQSHVYLQLREGQICHEEGSRGWVCKKAKDCPQLGDIRKAHHYICGYEGRWPIVCCPPSDTQVRNRFTEAPLIKKTDERPVWPAFPPNNKYAAERTQTTPPFEETKRTRRPPHPDVSPFHSFKKPVWPTFQPTTPTPFKTDQNSPSEPILPEVDATTTLPSPQTQLTQETSTLTTTPSFPLTDASSNTPDPFQLLLNILSSTVDPSSATSESILPPTDSLPLIDTRPTESPVSPSDPTTPTDALSTEAPPSETSTDGASTGVTNSRIALQKCWEFDPCNPPPPPGFFELAVVGGYNANGKAHPHMAIIGVGPEDNKRWICGGSLISEKFILTAAHCSPEGTEDAAQWVRLGELDISREDDDAAPQDFRIIRRILHPLYQAPQVYNDIALYELDRNVTLTDWVKPICLFVQPNVTEDRATVTGWGRLEFAGPTSEALQEVRLPVLSDDVCATLYPSPGSALIPSGFNSTVMMCAGERAGGKDSCLGDSGGPLVIRERSCRQFALAGIVSFGQQCALPDKPGIYTRVSQYIDWIENIVWPQ